MGNIMNMYRYHLIDTSVPQMLKINKNNLAHLS